MLAALLTSGKAPGVIGKPGSGESRAAGIAGSGSVTEAKYMKRIADRITKSVLVRLYGKSRTGNHMRAVFAENAFLLLQFGCIFQVERSAVRHFSPQFDPAVPNLFYPPLSA